MGNILTTFVKKECSNWDADHCMGAYAFNEGLFNTAGKCFIMENKPCCFFEDCVLPSAKNDNSYDKILRLYSKINPEFKPKETNTCNDCGKTIPGRRRYCYECAKKRRKKTFKNSSRKYRH